MFSNPAIEKYLMLQQMAQMQQQGQLPQAGEAPQMPHMGHTESPDTPISRGARMGTEASRRSFELSDSDNRRAMGRALMHFASSRTVPPPGSGLAGALGSFNQGFLPALNAYDAERDRILSEQLVLQQMEQKQQALDQKQQMQQMKFLNDLMEKERPYHEMTQYEKEALGLRRGMSGRGSEELNRAMERREALASKGLLPEGALMFGEIEDKNIRKEKLKDLKDRASRFNPAVKNIKSLEQMQEIIDNHPNLWKNIGPIISEQTPGISKALLSNLNPGEISAAQKFKKLTSDIAVNYIKQFPGRPTDIIKKTIIGSLAETSTSPEAFSLIKKNLIEENMKNAKDAERAHKGWAKGYYVPEEIEEQANYIKDFGREDLLPGENPSNEPPGARPAAIQIRKPDGSVWALPPDISEQDLKALIDAGAEVID